MVKSQEDFVVELVGYHPEDARRFKGPYNQIMPEIIENNFSPWSPRDVIDKRVNDNSRPNGQSYLWGHEWGTDFGIVGTKGKLYFFPNCEFLTNITPETELTEGGILLSSDQLQSSIFKGFDRNE